MKKVFQKLKLGIHLCVVLLLVSCAKSNEKPPIEDLFEPSFKEQKNGKFMEFFDSISYTYSNYKYNIAVNVPKTWKYDKGISEHMIFRSYDSDSGYVFSVNVIETKYNIENNFWKLYDENSEKIDQELKKAMEMQVNTEVVTKTSTTTYLKNHKTLKRKYLYTLKDEDFEVEMFCIMYQVPIDNFTYTITLHVPKIFYDERPLFFDKLFSGIYWLANKDKINKQILNIK